MIDFERINNDLLRRSREFVRELFPKAEFSGHEAKIGSLAGERGKSLSINLETGVWKDFATGDGGSDLVSLGAAVWGCSQGEAAKRIAGDRVGANGVEIANLGATAATDDEDDDLWYRRPENKPEVAYNYQNADGETVLTIYRWKHPKTGQKFIRPWDVKASEWRWPSGPLPLFNLLDIIETPPNIPVVVAEGEKAAEAISVAGRMTTEELPRFVGTCSAGGSNAASKTDWSPLAGRVVVIWPDNDEPGLKYANEVKEILKRVGVVRIYIVRHRPGEKAGADAADYDFECILDRIYHAFRQLPAPDVPIRLNLGAWRIDPVRHKPKPLEWLVDGVIPIGGVTMFAGQGGVGKGLLLAQLATEVAYHHGVARDSIDVEVFGSKLAKAGRVVMLLGEDTIDEVTRRVQRALRGRDVPPLFSEKLSAVSLPALGGLYPLVKMGRDGAQLTEQFYDLVNELAGCDDLACVIIDPLARFVFGEIENDPSAVNVLLAALGQLAARLNCAVIVVHHLAKARGNQKDRVNDLETAREAIRGSTALVDSSRAVIAIWEERNAQAAQYVIAREKVSGTVLQLGLVKSNASSPRILATIIRKPDGSLLTCPPVPKLDNTQAVATPAEAERVPGRYTEHDAQVDLLVWSVKKLVDTGFAIHRTGSRSVFNLKANLPSPLRNMQRKAIESLVDKAITSGRLIRLVDGILIASGQDVSIDAFDNSKPMPVLRLEDYEREVAERKWPLSR